MNVLLTGASGFLGGYLRRLLHDNVVTCTTRRGFVGESHPNERWLPIDLTDDRAVDLLVEETKPDLVIHAAACPLIREHRPRLSLDNYLTTHLLLDKVRCRFVLVSSAAVYGDRPGVRVESDQTPPGSVYAVTKLASEHLVGVYTQMGLVDGAIVRPVAMVGKGNHHGLVHDIVRKLKSPSPTLDLLGNRPGSRKPYVHVADVAQLVVRVAMRPNYQTILDASNPDSLSVEEVAQLAMRLTGIEKPIVWGGQTWHGDQGLLEVSGQRARDEGFVFRWPSSVEAVTRAIEESFT